VKVIPPFLELARQKRMQQVRSLAQAMAQSAKKAQDCEVCLRNLERAIVTNPHQAIALRLDVAHQRALLQTWEMRRDMAGDAMRSIWRRLAA
jgi:hemoglobin-like flavoprotein